MSFDISVQCFRSGRPEPIPRKIFDEIFASHDMNPAAREEDPGYVVLEYPDGGGGAVYLSDDDTTEEASSIMFNHCGGNSFFADMYELARRTRSIIFWPDADPIYLYTDESVRGELKGIEYFEEARSVLIRGGADIIKAIEES